MMRKIEICKISIPRIVVHGRYYITNLPFFCFFYLFAGLSEMLSQKILIFHFPVSSRHELFLFEHLLFYFTDCAYFIVDIVIIYFFIIVNIIIIIIVIIFIIIINFIVIIIVTFIQCMKQIKLCLIKID